MRLLFGCRKTVELGVGLLWLLLAGRRRIGRLMLLFGRAKSFGGHVGRLVALLTGGTVHYKCVFVGLFVSVVSFIFGSKLCFVFFLKPQMILKWFIVSSREFVQVGENSKRRMYIYKKVHS